MFLTRLVLADTDEPDLWVVWSVLRWDAGDTGPIEVPVGTLTDLASIPRLFRNLPGLDPNGRSRRAAVLHDFLYRSATPHGRAWADMVLREAMRADHVNWLGRWIFWAAVRSFGWACWPHKPAAASS